jgi:hypothetical protein
LTILVNPHFTCHAAPTGKGIISKERFTVSLNIALAIIALGVSAYTAFSFFKAGKFKATASAETMIQAGFGWIEPISFGLVGLIAWLEIAGAVGVILAPIVAYALPGFAWLQWVGVAAAVGLALTMVGAAWVHIARKEFAYTWKMNVSLFSWAVSAAAFQAAVVLPLFV